MAASLFVVATPIGNLGDLSPRAAETLAAVDFIAAEDTRVTLRLLNHLGLKKPLVSYHRHSEPQRVAEILARLTAGESGALCTDAGTPAVSDPGEGLVNAAHAAGIPVVPVAGPSAVAAALSVAGLPGGRYVFEGFLPQNKRQRRERLQPLAAEGRTIVLYEAPHKLLRTLEDLAETMGGHRPLVICRELTKLHEEIWPTTLQEALAHYRTQPPRGEFVLVVAGCPPAAEETPALTLEQAVTLAQELQQQGLAPSAAAKQAAAQSGQSRRDIYAAMQLSADIE